MTTSGSASTPIGPGGGAALPVSAPTAGAVARATRERAVVTGRILGWSFTPLRGKRPIGDGWQSAPREDEPTALAWAAQGNIGLRTGSTSGVVVIDIDSGKGGETPKGLPATATVRTGGGGLHLYFKIPAGETIGNSVSRLAPKVDVRGENGQVVYVGSVHPETGATYEWQTGLSPNEVGIAELPSWVVDTLRGARTPSASSSSATTPAATMSAAHGALHHHGTGLTPYGAKVLDDVCSEVAASVPGERNAKLNQAAFRVGQLAGEGDVQESVARALLLVAASACGLDEAEANATIDSGIAGGLKSPRGSKTASAKKASSRTSPPASSHAPSSGRVKSSASVAKEELEEYELSLTEITHGPDGLPLTDWGNARRFVHSETGDVHYATGIGWIRFDGVRWVPSEDDGEAVRRVGSLTGKMASLIGAIIDDVERKRWRKWCEQSQGLARITACHTIARSLPPIMALATAFDSDESEFLLACPNGTIDLTTGVVRAPKREDRLTMATAVRYEPTAKCPTWDKFIHTIFGGNADLIGFVQRAAGYTATGSTREQVFFLLHGTGSNGKSTLVKTLRAVLGDYARNADFQTFLQSRTAGASSGQARSDLARLRGSRLVTASEPDEGARFSESVLKSITGGEPVTARFQYQAEFEYMPRLKLWLSANHKPRVSGSDFAMFRRTRLIPFTVRIPDADKDVDLDKKLLAESEGILAWIVRGAVEWSKGGLRTISEVKLATEEYREENDLLGSFVAEFCVEDPTASIEATALYKEFQAFVEREGEHEWSQTRFGRGLIERKGVTRRRDGVTRRQCYYGIDLRSLFTPPPTPAVPYVTLPPVPPHGTREPGED